jgi:hypothetical protein
MSEAAAEHGPGGEHGDLGRDGQDGDGQDVGGLDWEVPVDPEEDGIDAAAWLAGMPADAADEDGPAPWTGEGEAFAAGFLHHDPDGQFGMGFAAGGELDGLAPGPELAAALAAATGAGAGHGRLGESELIGALCGWQRIAAWAAAGQAAAITALGQRRRAQGREQETRHLAEHVPEEVAAALVLTGRAAGLLIADAAGLARLPEVHAALAAGRIDWRRATVFTDELDNVADDHDAEAIAGQVLPAAARMTSSQLRRVLRRAVLDHDPGAADRRAADAAAHDAAVHAWTEHSGNAALAGRELPEADVIAADRRLTALARWLRDGGTAGTVDQLRAAVFTALLTGRPVSDLLPDTAAAAVDPDSPLTAGSTAVTGTVHLTMPLSTWAGLAHASGEVTGYGPAAPATCRDLASHLTASPGTTWCLTLTGPAGQALAHACAPRGRPPPAAGPAALHWAAALTGQLTWLQTGTCQHPRQENQYRPSRPLAHLIRIRQPACSFPGCGRPATRSDLDHTIPYQDGGRTCECNLAPACRTHHRAKQTPGWHLDQDQPAHLTWTTPTGRTYQPALIGYPA